MRYFILWFVIVFIIFSCDQKPTFSLKEGDLLFQQSDCGNFCDAINKVTDGINGIDFNHIGILLKDSTDNWVVLEAVTAGVKETPLNEFLNRALDKNDEPLVAVGRLKNEYGNIIPKISKSGVQYLNKSYDPIFDIQNDNYYCSELVYLLYTDSLGNPLFHLAPMTFKDPETNQTFDVWQVYFDELDQPIPEGEPGLNPGGISKSEVLDIYFPYSDFKN